MRESRTYRRLHCVAEAGLSLTALLFAVAFLVGCAMALLRHPIYGVLTYVGTFYLHPPSRWWGQGLLHDVRWAFIAAAVTLVALAVGRQRPPAIKMTSHGVTWGMLGFAAWILLQSFWAIGPESHRLLIEYYVKFLLAVYLIYRSIDSEYHLRLFLWSHVLGCFYFGWIAYTTYTGGRFEGFGGPGIGEANAGALTMVTGVFVAASLFLAGRPRIKALLIGVIPFVVNGIVTTISRSGFLAMGIGGIVYNLFTPKRFSRRVRLLSVLAVVLFAMLTNPIYWMRIQSIKHTGAQVEGMDTGSGRLDIMAAQLRMFRDNPLGCGHFCTEILSPYYLPSEELNQESGSRASHNTFLGLLVDQGFIGGAAYLLMLAWVAGAIRRLARRYWGTQDFQATLLPAIAAAFAAMTIGDMFVPYVRYEVRFWFIAVLMAMLNLSASIATGRNDESAIAARAPTDNTHGQR
jgi:O-antigen ligase